jgi:hypothetical protein
MTPSTPLSARAPEGALRHTARQSATTLFALGFITLFLELVLIRYLAGSVWNLGYFPNLVLLAVFVGMGIGFVFHTAVPARLSPAVFNAAFFVLLLMVAGVRWTRPVMPGFDPWSGEVGGELYFTATPLVSESANYVRFLGLFLAIALAFACISQRTAKVFRAFTPLHAYTLDIFGSVVGILAFMLASFLELPAFSWFAIALPAALWIARHDEPRPLRFLPVVPVAVICVLAFMQDTKLMQSSRFTGELEVRWSPYQKVEIVHASSPNPTILVNGINHQEMLPPEALGKTFYQEPYKNRRRRGLPKYRNVLVLGAGSGNDVAAALLNGAEHVDALEIDPVIADLGRKHHKAQPYSDPRVTLTIDDGRAFMTRTQRRYDLIVFALTDSVVKVSSMAQLRLENYLFTEDSLRRAYELLSENGEVLLYNFYRRPWLIEKFQRMMHAATGKYPAKVLESRDFLIFMAGPSYGAEQPPAFASAPPTVEIPTDDWPFPYLKRRQIPSFYTKALVSVGLAVGLLLALLEFLNRRRGSGAASSANLATKLAFVLMGGAFLLLETKSIVQFSLLFGTTWVNSSLVFVAILLLVLAANAAARMVRDTRSLWIAYGLLMLSCGITLLFPLKGLLQFESALVRFILASAMTFLPIFFANLIFSVNFRDQAVPEHLFGWNLLGATLGGVLEYTSMAVGYNALAVIVAVSYALVFLLFAVAGRSTGSAASAASPQQPPPAP